MIIFKGKTVRDINLIGNIFGIYILFLSLIYCLGMVIAVCRGFAYKSDIQKSFENARVRQFSFLLFKFLCLKLILKCSFFIISLLYSFLNWSY